jgi:hypothetical protein
MVAGFFMVYRNKKMEVTSIATRLALCPAVTSGRTTRVYACEYALGLADAFETRTKGMDDELKGFALEYLQGLFDTRLNPGMTQTPEDLVDFAVTTCTETLDEIRAIMLASSESEVEVPPAKVEAAPDVEPEADPDPEPKLELQVEEATKDESPLTAQQVSDFEINELGLPLPVVHAYGKFGFTKVGQLITFRKSKPFQEVKGIGLERASETEAAIEQLQSRIAK